MTGDAARVATIYDELRMWTTTDRDAAAGVTQLFDPIFTFADCADTVVDDAHLHPAPARGFKSFGYAIERPAWLPQIVLDVDRGSSRRKVGDECVEERIVLNDRRSISVGERRVRHPGK